MEAKNILPPDKAQSQDLGEINYTPGGLKILARIIAQDLLTKRSGWDKKNNANLNILSKSTDSNENVS